MRSVVAAPIDAERPSRPKRRARGGVGNQAAASSTGSPRSLTPMLRWLTRIGIALGAIVVILVLATVTMYAVAEHRVNKQHAITPRSVAVPTDSASIARGQH